MSVNIGKLNKGGLGSTSFGANKKTSGLSSQAAKNLSGSSAATKSSLFQFGKAKRSNFVPGQHVRKDMSKYDFSGTRARLNAGVGSTSRAAYSGSIGNVGTANYTVNNNTSYQKGMVVGQILNGTFGLLNQLGVFGGKNGGSIGSLGDKIDSALSGLGGNGGGNVSADISGSVSAMNSASDSASLRGAISNANNQLYSMNGQTGILEQSADTALKNKDSYETKCDTCESQATKAKNDLGIANQTVKATTAQRDNMKNAVSQADANYGKAVDNYSKAHDAHQDAKNNLSSAKQATASANSAYQSAVSTYESTPDKISDGNGNMVENPAKKQAKAAMDEAKQKLDDAKAAEAKADQAEKQAATQEQTASDAKETAYKTLGDKKEAVDAAESKLKTAQTQMDKAKENQTKAQDTFVKAQEKLQEATKQLTDAQGAIEKLKVHKRNVKDLQDAISKQNERLAKMEKEEQEQYDKYDSKATKGINKNNDRASTINGAVDTRSERRTASKMEKTNGQVNENLAKRNSYSSLKTDSEWIQNTLMKQSGNVYQGETYRTGTTPSGATVYYKGTMPISEEEYNNAKKHAGF